MAAKLLNSGEVSSIVSKQERSIKVLTENLEQKYRTIRNYMDSYWWFSGSLMISSPVRATQTHTTLKNSLEIQSSLLVLSTKP